MLSKPVSRFLRDISEYRCLLADYVSLHTRTDIIDSSYAGILCACVLPVLGPRVYYRVECKPSVVRDCSSHFKGRVITYNRVSRFYDERTNESLHVRVTYHEICVNQVRANTLQTYT